eukprot:5501583-Pyramimonas_sp.AAC.1
MAYPTMQTGVALSCGSTTECSEPRKGAPYQGSALFWKRYCSLQTVDSRSACGEDVMGLAVADAS